MKPDSRLSKAKTRKAVGSQSHHIGYAFEDKVAEAYRLLGYSVEHGRVFSGRQVDLYIEMELGDLQIRRAIECKSGPVDVNHIDKFSIKLQLVRREYPDALGTIVGATSFTDGVNAHAKAAGIQLTPYRDLSARILDGPAYAQALVREIESNELYRPDLFVDPLIGYESSGEGRNAFEVLDAWMLDSNWSQLTLLGDVGTGKSFLSRMLALRLAKEYLKHPTQAPLPLLVDLRNADREFSLEGLILTHFAKYGLSRATFSIFQFLLAEGQIVLILDGFDEMASRVTPQITARNFHELARGVKRSAKVCLTCRTHYFKSRTEEEEVVLGGSGPQSSEVARELYWDLISRSGFKIAYLRPFTISQVEAYVRKVHPNSVPQILAKINTVYNLGELSQRPLLLEMIVKSIDKLTTGQVNSAHLYEVFTGAWIQRDRWRDLMRPDDKLKFLTSLALSMWEQEKSTIDHRQLEVYVGSELASLIDSTQKLIEFDGEIRTASFLVRDAHGQYGFAHSSYAEYFLAKYIAAHIAAGNVGVLAIRRLTNEVIDFLLWMVDRTSFEEMLTVVLGHEYQPLLSENALVVLYRLRRTLLVEEKSRGSDAAGLQIEMPTGMRLQGAKLAQINLEGAIICGARLDGADLQQSILIGANLTNASLRSASVSKGDFQAACLERVDASDASMPEVNFNGAIVAGCDFSRADLAGSILTVKDFSRAVFRDAVLGSAILPVGDVEMISGEALPKALDATEWDREETLKKVFGLARRYAMKQGAGVDSDDVASDVVVYLLSNPSELVRLRERQGRLGLIARTLAWRRLSTLRQEERAWDLPGSGSRRDVSSPDEVGYASAENAPEGYSIDAMSSGKSPRSDSESSETESHTEEFDFDNALSEDPFSDLLYGPEEERLANLDLMEVLGRVMSEEALGLLVARYVEGRSVGEIAKQRGVSELEIVRLLNATRDLARRTLGPFLES